MRYLLWYQAWQSDWPLHLLLLLTPIASWGTTATLAVLVWLIMLSRWQHVATTHTRHLIPFMISNLGLVDTELAEVALKVGVVLQAAYRVFIVHDLLAWAAAVLMGTVLILAVSQWLTAFWLVRLRLLLIHAYSFILVKWTWILQSTTIQIIEHLMRRTATRRV